VHGLKFERLSSKWGVQRDPSQQRCRRFLLLGVWGYPPNL
jgi:hypothetical protein